MGKEPSPLLLLADLSWQDNAACLGMYQESGEDLFFPPFSEGRIPAGQAARVREAKKVCATCPVKKQCLRYALRNNCTGVWGGTTDSERNRMPR